MADDDNYTAQPQPAPVDPYPNSNWTGQDSNAPSGAPLGLPEPTPAPAPSYDPMSGLPMSGQKPQDRTDLTSTPEPTYDPMSGLEMGTKKPPQSIKDYMQRTEAMPNDRYDAEGKKFDPKNELTPGQRHLQIIANQENPADKMSALQTGAQRYDLGHAAAQVAADNDHTYKSVEFMNHAAEYAPGLHGTKFTETRDGVTVTQGDQVYNLRHDQWRDLLRNNDMHFDQVQRNGLTDAIGRVTRDRAPVGAVGPGSETPEFEQMKGPADYVPKPDARDTNVPAPERADLPGVKGGPLNAEEGPTKQQVAPGYERPTPRPTAPGSKDQGLTAEEQKPVKGISPGDYQRMTPEQRAAMSQEERDYTRGEMFNQGAAGGQQGAPAAPQQGIPTPEERRAAYERGAAGGAQPAAPQRQVQSAPAPTPAQPQAAPAPNPAQAQAGAQQFRQQLPPGAIRDPDNPERIITNPSPAMRRIAETGSLDQNRGGPGFIDPTTGRLSTQRPGSVGPDNVVTYQGKAMPMREAEALANQSAAQNPQPRAGYGPVPEGYAITPQSGGQPVTQVQAASIHHPAEYATARNAGKNAGDRVYEKKGEFGQPIMAPVAGSQQGRGGGERFHGLNTDEAGLTAGERTARATNQRIEYNRILKSAADGEPVSDAEKDWARQYGERIRGGGGQAPQPQAQQTQAPPEAIQMLQQNPGLAAAFDSKYGQGASRHFLGQ